MIPFDIRVFLLLNGSNNEIEIGDFELILEDGNGVVWRGMVINFVAFSILILSLCVLCLIVFLSFSLFWVLFLWVNPFVFKKIKYPIEFSCSFLLMFYFLSMSSIYFVFMCNKLAFVHVIT